MSAPLEKDVCPYCGSDDLEPFETVAGCYCWGCHSNVHVVEVVEVDPDEVS